MASFIYSLPPDCFVEFNHDDNVIVIRMPPGKTIPTAEPDGFRMPQAGRPGWLRVPIGEHHVLAIQERT